MAAGFAPGDAVNAFLVRGADTKTPLVTVFQAQQLRPLLPPASGPLQQLRRLDRRHEELDRSGAIHFLPHDGFDLANYPKSERHPGVNSAGEPPDQARTDHQLVADELRVGRGLLERCKKVSRSAHSGGRDILLELARLAAAGRLRLQ